VWFPAMLMMSLVGLAILATNRNSSPYRELGCESLDSSGLKSRVGTDGRGGSHSLAAKALLDAFGRTLGPFFLPFFLIHFSDAKAKN